MYSDSMKPLIGINLDVRTGPPPETAVQTTYTQSILKAGGVPILLPPMPDDELADAVKNLAGLMLIGGLDYCPSNYGEEPHASVETMHPERERFDMRLMKKILNETELPILGICAGSQLLNIILGGTLIQDIATEFPDSQVNHSSAPNGWVKGHRMHDVLIQPGTQLAKYYPNSRVSVPTSHHQAIRKVGQGLVANAFCDDGVIEATELPSRSSFTIGVQWHPERDYETNKLLFEAFVQSACLYMSGQKPEQKAVAQR